MIIANEIAICNMLILVLGGSPFASSAAKIFK